MLCVVTPDADVEVEGVPVAPLDVRCHDANKDYVVVTWKQPAVEGSTSILGYYVDRLVREMNVVTCCCSSVSAVTHCFSLHFASNHN